MNTKTKILTWLRWVAVLPAAVIAACAARAFVMIAYNWSSMWYMDPELFAYDGYNLFRETVASLAAGAAWIYGAYKVAPKYQMNVTYVMLCIGLVLGGMAITASMLQKSPAGILETLLTIVSMAIATYNLHQTEKS